MPRATPRPSTTIPGTGGAAHRYDKPPAETPDIPSRHPTRMGNQPAIGTTGMTAATGCGYRRSRCPASASLNSPSTPNSIYPSITP